MKRYDRAIRVYEMGITGKISHCIAQNLTIDPQFDITWYLTESAEVLINADVPMNVMTAIIKAAKEQAMNEYAMWLAGQPIPGHGGSQMHPEWILREDAIALAGFIRLRDNLRKEVISIVQEIAASSVQEEL